MKHTSKLTVCWVVLLATGRAVAEPQAAPRSDPTPAVCAPLLERQRIAPSPEALLELASCLESDGKIATATLRFRQLQQLLSGGEQPELARAAAERIQTLEPRVPHVTVRVATELAPREQVHFDGELLGPPAWGKPFAVDPGSYEVVASAEGRQPWRTRIEVAAGEQLVLNVPALSTQASAPPPAPEAAGESGRATGPAGPVLDTGSELEDRGGWSRRHTALLSAGLGLAALGTGAVFGLRALAKRRDSDRYCPTDTTCMGPGESLNDQALSAARVADVTLALGLLGAGLGAYLWLSSGTDDPVRSLSAELDPGGGRIALRGAW